MLYRFLAALIVLFWVTMTGLLLRKELGPGDTSLREVPVTHVMKMMLAHEQASDLQIYSDKLSVGRLQIHPHIRKEDGHRRVELSGALQLTVPGMNHQRVTWSGELELDAQLEAQRFKIAVTFREPAAYTLEMIMEPAEHRLTVESRAGRQLIRRSQYSLDEKGAGDWIRDQGIDPALLLSLQNPRSATLVVRALQSSLEVRGERVETFVVSAEQGEQTLLEAHISQLGQVLRVRSFLGYSAAPDDMTP